MKGDIFNPSLIGKTGKLSRNFIIQINISKLKGKISCTSSCIAISIRTITDPQQTNIHKIKPRQTNTKHNIVQNNC